MNKIKMLIFVSLLFCSALHAMHDAKTEADRAIIEKAKARVEKTEPDEKGLLGALGMQGISLITQVAQDREKYETQKKKKEDAAVRKAALKAWKEACSKSKKTVGFEKFFQLPYILQEKIMYEYYRDVRALYALRHKRELAPFMIEYIPLGDDQDTQYILNNIDIIISRTKRIVNKELQFNKNNHISITPLKILLSNQLIAGYFREHPVCIDSKNERYHREIRINDSIGIFGYSDCTYDILFNPQQFTKFVNDFSLQQLQFLVSLAHANPSAKIVYLSPQDQEIFKTFSLEMRTFITQRYPCVEFVKPIVNSQGSNTLVSWIASKMRACCKK